MHFSLAGRALRKIGRGFGRLGNLVDSPAIAPDPRQQAVQARLDRWHAIDGDQTLRLGTLDLAPHSVVFDLGGYDASFTVEVFARFACTVFLFEPCRRFFDPIYQRLHRNPRLKLFPFGLAASTRTETVAVNGAGTSVYRTGEATEPIKLFKVEEFFRREPVTEIDLLKVNIEGGEYELLDHLIETGLIGRVRDLQVQFHDDVFPDADRRMRAIHEGLAKTHKPLWQHEWVWESWRRV